MKHGVMTGVGLLVPDDIMHPPNSKCCDIDIVYSI